MKNSGKRVNGWLKACSMSVAVGSLVPGVAGDEVTPRLETGLFSPESLGKVLNLGPFEIRPRFAGSVLYDDNIQITSTGQQEDLVWTIAPGMLIGVGDYQSTEETYLALDYTPTLSLFTDYDENNGLNHDVNFYGQWRRTKFTLGLGQNYQLRTGGLVSADTSSGLDREVSSQQVDREIFLTTLKSKYDFSDKTFFEINGSQTINRSDEFIPYNEWVVENWAAYRASDKITTGAGFTLGFTDIQGSPNQVFERLLVRGSYLATEKVDINASVGVEFRQIQDGEAKDPAFIFNLGSTYRPTERTTLALEAYRQNQNSVLLTAQNYTVTGLTGSVRQQLMEKFYLSLSGGYQFLEYESNTGVSVGPDREDHYFFVGPGLDYNISEQWTAGIFYQYRKNDSNNTGSEFDNNQVGLRTTFRF